MNENPLTELISRRGFDRYQPDLISRFRAYGISYELTYGRSTEKSAMWLDFEDHIHDARITVWESGECELEVLETATGTIVKQEHHQLKNETEFHRLVTRLVLFMKETEGLPHPPP